jgi:hypothetical protein
MAVDYAWLNVQPAELLWGRQATCGKGLVVKYHAKEYHVRAKNNR